MVIHTNCGVTKIVRLGHDKSQSVAAVQTGVACKEPTTFSDTGLCKGSIGLGSTRWIGDAKGPVFIECGARGERGEYSPLVDGDRV